MAYNPYNVVGTQQGLLDSLLQSEQARTAGQTAVGEQVGQMGEEFQKEQIAAQKEQEKLINKKRKRGFLEKIAPIAAMFIPGGPLVSGLISGATGMYSQKAQQKHMERQIGKARQAEMDSKWGKTFLGKQAREIGAQQETMLDDLLEQSKVSDLGLLTTGLTEGVKGYAMGKAGESVKQSIENVKLQKALEASDVDIGAADFNIEGLKTSNPDLYKQIDKFKTQYGADWKTKLEGIQESGTVGTEGYTAGRAGVSDSYLKEIFGDLVSPDTLIGDDSQGEKAMQYIGLLTDLLSGKEY